VNVESRLAGMVVHVPLEKGLSEVQLLVERSKNARRIRTSMRYVETAERLEGVIGGLREQRKPVTVRNIYLDSGILITKGSRFDRILCDLSLGRNDRSDGSEQ
jgi:hypothetical protein